MEVLQNKFQPITKIFKMNNLCAMSTITVTYFTMKEFPLD